MRRSDREVTDLNEINEILKLCKTCHIAMVDCGKPYVVPLSYGYELQGSELTMYLHCAKQGRKLDILSVNPEVCFELCNEGTPVNAANNPCNSGYYYSSLIGNGIVEFVTDPSEKCKALSLLLKQQSNLDVTFTKEQADTVCVFKIATTDYTGKRKPMPVK